MGFTKPASQMLLPTCIFLNNYSIDYMLFALDTLLINVSSALQFDLLWEERLNNSESTEFKSLALEVQEVVGMYNIILSLTPNAILNYFSYVQLFAVKI